MAKSNLGMLQLDENILYDSSGNARVDLSGANVSLKNTSGTISPVGTNGVVTASITDAAVTSAKLDSSTIQYATVTVSSAEILALFTTAKALVAAPGANKVIEFVEGTISYLFGATAYTVGSSTNLSVKYKDKTGADTSSTRATTGFIDQSSNQYYMLRPLTATLTLDTNAVNQPLCLALLVANPTLGDGTFKVNVAYRVHTLV